MIANVKKIKKKKKNASMWYVQDPPEKLKKLH